MAHRQVIEYAEDLARRVCRCESCDGLALRQSCHPYAGMLVEFERSTATLVLLCRQCLLPVWGPIAVARDPRLGN